MKITYPLKSSWKNITLARATNSKYVDCRKAALLFGRPPFLLQVTFFEDKAISNAIVLY